MGMIDEESKTLTVVGVYVQAAWRQRRVTGVDMTREVRQWAANSMTPPHALEVGIGTNYASSLDSKN